MCTVWAVGVALAYAALAPPPAARQPVAFNHVTHSPMACRVCHAGVETRARAALPSSPLCSGCHARSPRSTAREAAAWERIETAADLDWVSLSRLPEHAFFSHQTHVRTARLACRNCHGEFERQTLPPGRALVSLDMEACLRCHEKLRASSDCAACHR